MHSNPSRMVPISLPRIVKFAEQVEASGAASLSNQSFQSFFSNSLSIEPGAASTGVDYHSSNSRTSINHNVSDEIHSNSNINNSSSSNATSLNKTIGADDRLVKKKKISFEVGVHPSKENKPPSLACEKADLSATGPNETKFHNRNASLLSRPKPIPDAMQPMDFGNWKISEWPKTVVIINGRPYVKLKRVGKGGSSIVYKVCLID